MNENNENKPAETIVTAKIHKSGPTVKRFVHPAKTVLLEMPHFALSRLRENLRKNNRVVFFDGSNEEEICDFYNVLTPEGNLEPCCRALKDFKANCHKDNDVKIALKYKGGIVGAETLGRLNYEARQYRDRVSARRQRAVPRRVIKAECPKCGKIFDVELSGFGNEE